MRLWISGRSSRAHFSGFPECKNVQQDLKKKKKSCFLHSCGGNTDKQASAQICCSFPQTGKFSPLHPPAESERPDLWPEIYVSELSRWPAGAHLSSPKTSTGQVHRTSALRSHLLWTVVLDRRSQTSAASPVRQCMCEWMRFSGWHPSDCFSQPLKRISCRVSCRMCPLSSEESSVPTSLVRIVVFKSHQAVKGQQKAPDVGSHVPGERGVFTPRYDSL